jgi:hypothetical protein
METFFKGLFIGIGALVVIGLLAVFGGTIVYWLWPIAIPAAFPGLVENGTLAPELSWWVAVCLTWLFSILIKSSQTNNNNNN